MYFRFTQRFLNIICTTFFLAKVAITFNYTVGTIAIKNWAVFLHNPENSEFVLILKNFFENFGCLSTHLRNKLR